MKEVTEQILTICHSFVLQYRITGPNMICIHMTLHVLCKKIQNDNFFMNSG